MMVLHGSRFVACVCVCVGSGSGSGSDDGGVE